MIVKNIFFLNVLYILCFWIVLVNSIWVIYIIGFYEWFLLDKGIN